MHTNTSKLLIENAKKIRTLARGLLFSVLTICEPYWSRCVFLQWRWFQYILFCISKITNITELIYNIWFLGVVYNNSKFRSALLWRPLLLPTIVTKASPNYTSLGIVFYTIFCCVAVCTGDHVSNSDNNTQKNATPIPAHKGCAIVWKLYLL